MRLGEGRQHAVGGRGRRGGVRGGLTKAVQASMQVSITAYDGKNTQEAPGHYARDPHCTHIHVGKTRPRLTGELCSV